MVNFDQKKLNSFAKKAEVRFAVLFGSRAIGTGAKDSDFDIAVSLKNGKSIFEDINKYSKILENFSKIFAANEDKIDLADLDSANILLRYEITKKGVLLFGDHQLYEEFKAFSFRDYVDARSLFELENKIIKKRQIFIKKSLAV
ncbi:MAG: nucleotidyltransferase domain-containing protein [Candidatus Pacebacteria bacterium]|nr:nucleotidyltransferase domain-containing protein [Candidatus Paceibacterota bacterium]NUQ57551.1 nucleotidyltransferase domain-containing protein [Candidatus Paceibacter sp.]